MRQVHFVCAVLVCLVVTAWGQAPPPDWVTGDVFVGVSNNTYQVWHSSNPTAATPVYGFLTNISDGASTSGATKGCGFDLAYRFFGTNSDNNFVDRYSIDNAHPLAQQFPVPGNLGSGAASVQSVALDGGANLYVGYSGAANGFGTIERWTKDITPANPTFGLYKLTATYSVPVDNTHGPGWIDVDFDGKIYYTSQGPTIRTWDTSASPGLEAATFVTLSGGTTLYALRIVPGNTKQVLVAAQGNVLLVNSSGVVNKIQFGGNSNIQALSLDPRGSNRAWAGDVSSNDVTLIDYSAKSKIVTFNTGTGSSGPLGGICVDGSYSAAAAATAAAQTIVAVNQQTLSKNANTVTFVSPFTGATFTQTFADLSSNIQVTVRDSLVDPSLALSDPTVFSFNPGNPLPGSALPAGNLVCDQSLTSANGHPNTCELFELEANPNSGYSTANTQIQPPPLNPPPPPSPFFVDGLNLRLLRNLDEDITDDVDISGTKSTKCVFTTNRQVFTNSNICSFTPTFGTQFSKSGGTSTITFKLNVATGQCGSNSTTPTDLRPLLMIVQLQTNGAAPVPVPVLIAGKSGGPPVMTLSGNTYQLQVKTTDIPSGFTYVASVVDLAAQIPSVATQFTMTK